MLIKIIREAIETVRKRKADESDKAERAAIAKAFNDRYTFRHQWKPNAERLPGSAYGFAGPPRGGLAWMCPECNQIHLPTECSVFDGVHYPKCCNTAAGHRISHGIKTGA